MSYKLFLQVPGYIPYFLTPYIASPSLNVKLYGRVSDVEPTVHRMVIGCAGLLTLASQSPSGFRFVSLYCENYVRGYKKPSMCFCACCNVLRYVALDRIAVCIVLSVLYLCCNVICCVVA